MCAACSRSCPRQTTCASSSCRRTGGRRCVRRLAAPRAAPVLESQQLLRGLLDEGLDCVLIASQSPPEIVVGVLVEAVVGGNRACCAPSAETCGCASDTPSTRRPHSAGDSFLRSRSPRADLPLRLRRARRREGAFPPPPPPAYSAASNSSISTRPSWRITFRLTVPSCTRVGCCDSRTRSRSPA